MDASGFDRLTRSLSQSHTRRAAVGRRAAILAAAVGLTFPAPDDAAAGLRHRRRVRNQHDHDNRKGKRKDGNTDKNKRLLGTGPPQVDCRQPGSDGTPCAFVGEKYQLRCCNGGCPDPPTCLPLGAVTNVPCQSSADCLGDSASACCSGSAFCDNLEGLCSCYFADPGDPCGTDEDCVSAAPACVCGTCR